MWGLGQGLGFIADALAGSGLAPPVGFVFLVDADGVYLVDADGYYLLDRI